MATLRQLEVAFVNAHEAGDTEAAKVLAEEIRRMTAGAPAPEAKPQSGFMAGLKSGTEKLKGDVYAGLAALGVEGAEAKARAQAQKAAGMYQQPEFLEHPVDYVTGLLGQSVPYMAAPLAAGVAASPLGALGAMGAAGAASAAQFTGSNVARQLEEGRSAKDVNLGAAAAAAVPQAALDIIGFRFVPGLRALFGKAGVELTEDAVKGIAGKYILPALKTAGVEGATEAGQAVLERLQAGLAISDPEARKEYFDNFVGGAVLGGTLAVPGAALEGRRKPQEAAAPAPTPVAPERQRGEVTTLAPTEEELAAAAAKQKATEEAIPAVAAPEEAPVAEEAPAPQVTNNVVQLMDKLDELRPRTDELQAGLQEAAAAGDSAKVKDLFGQLQAHNEQVSALEDQIKQLGGVTQTTEEHAKEADKAIAALDKKIKTAQKKLSDAGELGDFEAMPGLADKLDALKAERAQMEETIAQQKELLRIKDTPKGETLAMFPAEQAQPLSREVIRPEEAKAGPLPAEREVKDTVTGDLFDQFNLLNTAINNQDERTLANMRRAREAADRKAFAEASSKLSPREEVYELLKNRIDRIVRREKNYDVYEATVDGERREFYVAEEAAKEIDRLRKIVESPVVDKNGVKKRSMLQLAHDWYATYQERLEKLNGLKEAKAPAERQAAQQKKVDYALKQYEDKLKKIEPYRKALDAQLAKITKTTEVATPRQKAAEAEALGRSERKMSREARMAKRINAGDVKREAEASENMRKLAQELGFAEPAYQAKLDKVKKALGRIILDKGKDSPEARQYYAKSYAELTKFAEDLGKKTPEYKTTLKEQIKQYTESAATAGEQEVKSKRTPQATRKLPKLGRMRTGTEESQAEVRERQARFEGSLKQEKENLRLQEMREQAQKVRERKTTTPTNAMRAAFEKTARDMAEGLAKEEGKFATETETLSPALTETQIKHLENNDVVSALRDISNSKDTSKLNRAVAMALANFLDATNVKLVDKLTTPDGAVALGEATSKEIKLNRNGGLTQEVLLHEGTHAAVERIIQVYNTDPNSLAQEQLLAARELDAIYKANKSDPKITSKNAKSSLSEFAAELFSNPELQKQLAAKKWRSSSMWDNIKSLILKMLGIKIPSNQLEAGLRAMEILMVPSSMEMPTAVAEAPKYKADEVGVQEEKPGIFSFKSPQQEAKIAPSFVAKDPSKVDSLKANFLGLAGRVQFVDQYAALSEAAKKGLEKGQITALEAEQAEYYLRFGQQRSQFAGQFLTNGPVQLTKQKTERGTEFIYKSTPGANMMQVADALAKSKIGNDTEKEAMLTALLAGERAKQVGWNKLNVADPARAQQEYAQIKAMLDARPEDKAMFEKAMDIYKEYNAGLLDFLVQTGAMSKDKAAELKKVTYVPYYRVNKGSGELELLVDNEHPVRIGNIKDEPQLKELVGDSTEILPIFTSAAQNTFLITEIGLRNQMVKENAFMLNKVGIASKIGKGAGPAGEDTVRFKHNGEDHFVVIDTDLYGIPASLIVKGMEGIKTSIPAAVRMLGVPADILRKFVTRNPAYAIKQAIRDPLTAWMTTGADGVPVLNSMKELATMVAGRSEAERKLMESGAISSNVFTGDKGDMQKFLRDISMGKSGWEKIMARADAFALQGDAATRAVIYKDSLNKGMSEMQAMLRTLESMNFSRRGLSPSMQMLSVLIPFFNAQIQGLDVLYRAFTGKMPFDQQLEVRKKLLARGILLGASSIAYAAMMQDDEAYKRAKPEERLGNWFLPTPFSDEPLRIPVPFELGYLFKSLPEAVVNMAAKDEKADDITKGMGKLIMLSNPFALPQAVKPATEVYLGKSFFGGDIESQRELHTMLPTERARTSTTEIAKMLGSVTGDAGLTPIKIDYLIRGYTGGLGVALVSMANPLLNTEVRGEAPSTKTSKMPIIGGLFQPVEGRGTLDAAYERMLEIKQAKGTFDSILASGDKEKAREFIDEYGNRIAAASVSGAMQQRLGELAKMKRMVETAPSMSTERKDAIIKKIEEQQNKMAEMFLGVTERTTRQAARP